MLHAWGVAMTSSLFALNGLPVYLNIALLAFGEAAAFVGLMLPGETALLGGGALASQGQRQRDCAHGGGDRGGCCRGLGQLRDRPPGGAIPAGGQARTLGGSATVGTGRSSGAPSRRHRGHSWPVGGGSARPGPGDCGCRTVAVPPGRQTGGRWARLVIGLGFSAGSAWQQVQGWLGLFNLLGRAAVAAGVSLAWLKRRRRDCVGAWRCGSPRFARVSMSACSRRGRESAFGAMWKPCSATDLPSWRGRHRLTQALPSRHLEPTDERPLISTV